jgi:hypothetical protein
MYGGATALYADTRAISVSHNGDVGIRMRAPSAGDSSLGLMNRIVSVNVTHNASDGLHIFGGTSVHVRNLYTTKNGSAVRVSDTGAEGATNDLRRIDLGTIDETGGGKSDRGNIRFSGNYTGICIDLQNPSGAGVLRAEGNVFNVLGSTTECFDAYKGPTTMLTFEPNCGVSLQVPNLGYTTPITLSSVLSTKYCQIPATP